MSDQANVSMNGESTGPEPTGGGEQQSSNQPGDASAEFVRLTVTAQDGNNVQFRIKKGTSMAKLMKTYAERVGTQLGTLRFLFDGRRITEEDTPQTLDMQDEDVIEAYQEQTGGYCK